MTHYHDYHYTEKLNVGDNEDKIDINTDTLRMSTDDTLKKLKIEDWMFSDGQSVTLDLSKYFVFEKAYLENTTYTESHESWKENYPTVWQFSYPHVRFRKKSDNTISLVCFLDKETIDKGPSPLPISNYLQPREKYDIELVDPISIQGQEDYIAGYMQPGSTSGHIFIKPVG